MSLHDLRPYQSRLGAAAKARGVELGGQWRSLDRTRLETFALVTTEPNELVAQIHDRLALILHPRDYDRWAFPRVAIRGLRSI